MTSTFNRATTCRPRREGVASWRMGLALASIGLGVLISPACKPAVEAVVPPQSASGSRHAAPPPPATVVAQRALAEPLPRLILQAAESSVAIDSGGQSLYSHHHVWSPDFTQVAISSSTGRFRRLDVARRRFLDEDDAFPQVSWLSKGHTAWVVRDAESVRSLARSTAPPVEGTYVVNTTSETLLYPNDPSSSKEWNLRVAKGSDTVVAIEPNASARRRLSFWRAGRSMTRHVPEEYSTHLSANEWLRGDGDMIALQKASGKVVLFSTAGASEALDVVGELPTIPDGTIAFDEGSALLLIAATTAPFRFTVYDTSVSPPRKVSSKVFPTSVELYGFGYNQSPPFVQWSLGLPGVVELSMRGKLQRLDARTLTARPSAPSTNDLPWTVDDNECAALGCKLVFSQRNQRDNKQVTLLPEFGERRYGWANHGEYFLIHWDAPRRTSVVDIAHQTVSEPIPNDDTSVLSDAGEISYVSPGGELIAHRLGDHNERELSVRGHRWRCHAFTMERDELTLSAWTKRDKSTPPTEVRWRANSEGVLRPTQTTTAAWVAEVTKPIVHTQLERCSPVYRDDAPDAARSSCLVAPGGAVFRRSADGKSMNFRPAPSASWRTVQSPSWDTLSDDFLFSPDERFVVASGQYGIALWNADAPSEIRTWSPPLATDFTLKFSSDSKSLLVLANGVAWLYRWEQPEPLQILLVDDGNSSVVPLVRDRAGFVDGPSAALSLVNYRLEGSNGYELATLAEAENRTQRRIHQPGMLGRFLRGEGPVVP